jgi:hypothetical protein
MAKKRQTTSAEQAAFDERTRMIDEAIERTGARSAENEQRIRSVRRGTFEQRTQAIRESIARLEARIAARRTAEQL